MIPAGDTNHGLLWAWLWEQRPHLALYEHHVLDYLTWSAHVTESNREGASVGQVLYSRSATRTITEVTGLSRSKVKSVLWDLQATHGYIHRFPRRGTRPQGHIPHIIQVYWTDEDDDARDLNRQGKQQLPWWFRLPAKQYGELSSLPENERDAALEKLLNGGPQHDPQGDAARPPDLRLVTPWGS